MAKFLITADSSCDGSLKELSDNDIKVICFKYGNDSGNYLDKMDDDEAKKFYQSMREGAFYKTSQINPQEYYDFFKSLANKNLPIIHVSLGSGLSNTINNIYVAKAMLDDDNIPMEIYPLDSKLASAGLVALIDKLISFRDDNLDVEEALDKINYYVKHLNTFYTTNTLTYFARGGRLSKVESLIGNLFKINPILDCTPAGTLRVIAKARGENKAINYLVEMVKKQVVEPEKQTLYLCHADNEEKSTALAERLVAEVGFKDYKQYFMGPIIGSHAGPNLLSVYFFGKERQ